MTVKDNKARLVECEELLTKALARIATLEAQLARTVVPMVTNHQKYLSEIIPVVNSLLEESIASHKKTA